MKRTFFMLAFAAINTIVISSCSSSRPTINYPYGTGVATTGVAGAGTSVTVKNEHKSDTPYDLVPVGDVITYTIDIGTPEGRQKLQGLSLNEAIALAETEALRKYKCNGFIDSHATYLLSNDGKRILKVTIDGQPAKYKMKSK